MLIMLLDSFGNQVGDLFQAPAALPRTLYRRACSSSSCGSVDRARPGHGAFALALQQAPQRVRAQLLIRHVGVQSVQQRFQQNDTRPVSPTVQHLGVG